MIHLVAMFASAAAAYLVDLAVGEHVSMFTDFMLGTVVGGVAYVGTIYGLKKLRGDF